MENKNQKEVLVEKVSFKRDGEIVNSLAISKDNLGELLSKAVSVTSLWSIAPEQACHPSVARVRFVNILLNAEFIIEVVNQIPEEAQEVVRVAAGKTLRSFLPSIRIRTDGSSSDISKLEVALKTQRFLVEAGRIVMDELRKVEYIYD